MKRLLIFLFFIPLVSASQSISKNELINYFDNESDLDPIEGLWTLNSVNTLYYKNQISNQEINQVYSEWGIKRYDKLSFKVIDIGEGSEQDKEPTRDFDAFFESSAIDGFYTYKVNWKQLKAEVKTNAKLSDEFSIQYEYWVPDELLPKRYVKLGYRQHWKFVWTKKYPKLNVSTPSSSNNENWSGNGSGLIISKSGYIITNHHVIEDADDIEVEFILNDEVQKFNAEIVQVDKVNDLAIIKIVDMNFDGVDELPYNFKTRSSDVGTKVYAYGYPMALSIMGKEIKITDGIISSKSGYDGDITTYQITAPIQGGNSGGPLFDDKGNLLGINSSGINKEIADNVGYTIKSNYVLNLIDVLPKNIELPSSTKLESLPLTEQIKEISKYVVLVKVK